MKRSSMIEAIVYNALSWDGLDTSGVPLEEIANDMLTICEKLGMLPPQALFKGNHKGCLCTMHESCSSCGGLCNEWESEDEEK